MPPFPATHGRSALPPAAVPCNMLTHGVNIGQAIKSEVRDMAG